MMPMAANISKHGFMCSACGCGDGFKSRLGFQPRFCPWCGESIQKRSVDVSSYQFIWTDFKRKETRVSHDGEHWEVVGGDAE